MKVFPGQKWEYLELPWTSIQGVLLNQYGMVGWELIQVLPKHKYEHVDIYLFKRPIIEELKPKKKWWQ